MKYITPGGKEVELDGEVTSIKMDKSPIDYFASYRPELCSRKAIRHYQYLLTRPFSVMLRVRREGDGYSTIRYEPFETKEEQQNWYNHCIETYLKK